MMRSMFSGVSGLRVHQTRMDVIGNNIANVNTVGFKSSRATFQEVFSQTLRGAGAPDSNTGRGGTNPMQVGLGLGLASIDTIMTTGSIQRTDNPTDLAIGGEGFFIVRGSKTDTEKFTRAGNMTIDELGNLNVGGMNVYGWQKYDTTTGKFEPKDLENQLEPINIFSDDHNGNKRTIAANKTENIKLSGNLDSSKPIGTASDFTAPMTVYDALGNEYKLNVKYTKTGTTPAPETTEWTWTLDGVPEDIDGVGIGTYTDVVDGTKTPVITGTITFDANGSIVDSPTDPIKTSTPFVQITPDAATGTSPFTMQMNFNAMTMYSGSNSVKPIDIDGYQSGTFVTLNIGSDGLITGIYSNGQQQPIGQIATTVFENAAGLLKAGENMYITSTNSGEFKKGLKPGSNGSGTLSPGTLEMSNVDLSREFTEMIITQRGFQANSRIITTSDEMLQELVNLKR